MKIEITRRALKDLEKIPQYQKSRIGKKLRDYADSPLKFAKKLTNPKIGNYRFRVGDYRIIFDIEDDKIMILRIGNRKDIYR